MPQVLRAATRRLATAAAAATLLLAGCGTQEPQTAGEVPTRLASYELATGEQTYEATSTTDGTMGFGDALRTAMGPSAGALTQDSPISVQLSMNVTQTVAEDGPDRKVTVRIDSVDGRVKAFGVDQPVDEQMLAKAGSSEVTYTMSSDGTTNVTGGSQLGGLGLGTLGAGVGGSCPRLPEGGVEAGQEWKTSQRVPVGGVEATVPSTNTYAIEADSGTVTSRTDGPVDVTVDFAEFAKSSPSLAGVGNLAGMTMHIAGTADLTSTCVLGLPGQELRSVESGGHISLTMSLAGTAHDPELAKLGEGEFLHMDVDTTAKMHQTA